MAAVSSLGLGLNVGLTSMQAVGGILAAKHTAKLEQIGIEWSRKFSALTALKNTRLIQFRRYDNVHNVLLEKAYLKEAQSI